jgi:hypothetical protein
MYERQDVSDSGLGVMHVQEKANAVANATTSKYPESCCSEFVVSMVKKTVLKSASR